MSEELRTFQRRFVSAATADSIDTACLSLPRGNGKSWLAGHLVGRVLDPADALFRAGTESVLCAASIEQARIVFRFARDLLEPLGEYRFLDSHTRIGITHKATNTRLRVIGSNGKTAMGLVGCPWVIADEPGAWEVNGGTLLHDAITTAQGKPGSPLRAVYIGTLAPALSGWWHDLIDDGSRGMTYVQALRGDPAKWDRWGEIRRCNPLVDISAEFRAKLLAERDDARRDSRLKARFLSYRLNIPSADEATMLLEVDDWERVCGRAVPDRSGRPIVGVDLGGGRAWSAAVAVWQSGRVEAVAVAPGIPSIEEQERRDRVPRGVYRALLDTGALAVADGLRVPTVAHLVNMATSNWGAPARILCDRFRLGELEDQTTGIRVEPRMTRWSEAAEDVRALRRLSKDGPLSCVESSRPLVTASLAAALVKNDDQGSTRLVKRGTNNEGRDDVAAALLLAAGAYEREQRRPTRRRPRHVVAQ
ncbi:hypothetical protein [Candidatus Poriferisodalis sp.]|uniref:hypothetical protein n=1 Tax=Candidatus Poriferisodalis sp. TaxID=3101277 RepID=UPI003B0214ED